MSPPSERPAAGKRPPASRAEVLATLAIVAAVALLGIGPMIARALGPHPSPAECAALLDRYVEHIAYVVDPRPASSVLEERRGLARAAASSRAAFSRCESDLTRPEVECAMKAESADAFERCLPAR